MCVYIYIYIYIYIHTHNIKEKPLQITHVRIFISVDLYFFDIRFASSRSNIKKKKIKGLLK